MDKPLYTVPTSGVGVTTFSCQGKKLKKLSYNNPCRDGLESCKHGLNCSFYHSADDLELFGRMQAQQKLVPKEMQIGIFVVPTSFVLTTFGKGQYVKVSLKKYCEFGCECEHELSCAYRHTIEELDGFSHEELEREAEKKAIEIRIKEQVNNMNMDKIRIFLDHLLMLWNQKDPGLLSISMQA